MDSITQALLGAAVGEAILGKKLKNKAMVVGAIVGTIPDLDVLLSPFYNDLEKISIHRGLSHSLLFCLIGSVLLMLLFKKIKWTQVVTKWEWWLFSFLTLLTHVMLDAFTTYGTQLFLPFSDLRVSFDSINVVDPFYSVPLIIGLIMSATLKKLDRNIPNSLGLIISSLYLVFTLGHKQHIESVFSLQLQKSEISHYDLLTVPVQFGNMVWYGAAKDAENLYLGKYSGLEKNEIDFQVFPINDHLLDNLDVELVDRMKWFANGFYTVAKDQDKVRIYNMQCDMQGVRQYGDYKAPTAFYFEIEQGADNEYLLTSGMHNKE